MKVNRVAGFLWLLALLLLSSLSGLAQSPDGKDRDLTLDVVVTDKAPPICIVHAGDDKAGALRLNGRRHAGGTGANHKNVKGSAVMRHKENSFYRAGAAHASPVG